MRTRKVNSLRVDKGEGRGAWKPLRMVFCCLLPIAFLMTVGCGGGSSPSTVPPKAKPAKAEVAKPQPAVAVAKGEEGNKEEVEYSYNPAGKADPFKPFIQLTPVTGAARNPLTPLQRYEISQLKLVAIISTPEGNVALVEDSAGKGFFLKRGTLIGKNDGKVSRVLKDKVIVEEIYQDVVGQTKQNEVSINLHQAEEGGEP